MTTPILSTKFYIPTPASNSVHRARLTDRLSEGLHRKLTLISASTGFGKTTLVAEWIARSNRKAAWLSLDEGDNDPARFLLYLVSALRTVEATMGESVFGVLQAPQSSPIESIMTALLNEIAAYPEPFILVLDDYHVIGTEQIHQALAFLLEHLPPKLHVVIVSREEPEISLARLRVQGQLTELRSADMQFTFDEASAFLTDTMELRLAPADIALLGTRTEGWIAGLQLAGLSLRGNPDLPGLIQSFTGSHRYLLDYLVEEVLQRQQANVQAFLLSTSILDRLCGSLADALLLDIAVSGQQMLRDLERANLFLVPLDEGRHWYRYHHLFGEMLRERLTLHAGSERIEELHRRAYRWHEDNGHIAEAIRHAIEAREYDSAAGCMERNLAAIIKSGDEAKLLQWIAALPLRSVVLRPDLFYYQVGTMAVRGHVQEAKSLLDRTLRMISDEEELFGSKERREMELRMGLYRASVAFYEGDVDTFVQLLDVNIEGLEKFESIVKVVNLGEALLYRGPIGFGGRLKKMAYLSAQVSSSEQRQRALHHTLQGYGYVFLADLYYEWNRLDDAQQVLELALAAPFSEQNLGVLTPGVILMSKIDQARNDDSGAETTIRQAIRRMETLRSPHWQLLLEARLARLQLAQGHREEAERWVRLRHIQASDSSSVSREYVNITLARLFLDGTQTEDAVRLLLQLEREARLANRVGSRIEIRLLLALAYQAQDKLVGAAESLSEACALAEAEGYVRLFLDEGKPILDLLARLKLVYPPIVPYMEQRVNKVMLTNRETAILRLIADGKSNEEIARSLYVSPGTVKRYTHNLYQKLEVNSRVQAVAKATDLRLL